ncbi:protein PET117 homolog, mitochondrial [Xenopus laevis]|nr:protein PET117 homolog, mitochondrial [Xenopus laevis]
MSTISKVVLGISVVLSVGTVVGVHVKQRLDRERLREGVLQDLERQSRKQENLRLLEEQIHLTKRLEAEREKILLTEGSSKF